MITIDKLIYWYLWVQVAIYVSSALLFLIDRLNPIQRVRPMLCSTSLSWSAPHRSISTCSASTRPSVSGSSLLGSSSSEASAKPIATSKTTSTRLHSTILKKRKFSTRTRETFISMEQRFSSAWPTYDIWATSMNTTRCRIK